MTCVKFSNNMYINKIYSFYLKLKLDFKLINIYIIHIRNQIIRQNIYKRRLNSDN